MPPIPTNDQQPTTYHFNFWETDPKRNFAPWFLKFCGVLIIVGIVLSGYFMYWAHRNYQAGVTVVEMYRQEFATFRQNSTSDWQMYRNDEYGFEFKYPDTWNISKFHKTGFDYSLIFYSENYKEGDENYSFPMISILTKRPNQNIEDFITEYSDGLPAQNRQTFNNITFLQSRAYESDRVLTYIGIPSTDIVLTFSVNQDSPEDKIFPSIFSTFKFVDSADTSTWKTYRSDKNGFEIKFPTSWFIQYEGNDAGLLVVANAPAVNNLHGPGIPKGPDGMWVDVYKVTCKPTADFVEDSMPDTLYKTVCKNDLQIDVGLWQSNPNLELNKSILNQILSTFKFIN